MKTVTLIVSLLYGSMMFAQGGQETNQNVLLPKIISGSPEAASLGKFGEWPVSQYTGVPGISIPLYSIKLKDLEIPVQLSYHAGGVKVDEISSWAGVGWALNAGGAITRTVVGLADDETGGIIANNQLGNTIKPFYSLTDNDDYVFFRKVATGVADAEPDIYYYNFMGSSGKFCFDADGNFHAIPANNLKIVKAAFAGLNGGGSGSDAAWVIADDKGNNYFFGSSDAVNGGINGVERTNSGASPLHAENSRVTSWYLTKIITADKADTINFDYDSKTELYFLARTLSLRALTNSGGIPSYPFGDNGNWGQYLGAVGTLYNGNPQPGVTQTQSLTNGASALKKIRWRGGAVDLVASTVRQDMGLQSSKMLDSIKVSDALGNKIKSFRFFYAYLQNRYFLDSLREYGSGGTFALKTGFEYINRNSLPASPSTTGIGSYAQDHWGYYNGAPNTTLLPQNLSMPSIIWPSLTANREPDTVKMQFGTLNKILYPTGGASVFEYESNRYDPASPAGGYNPPTVIISKNVTVQGNPATTTNQFASIDITPGITQSNVSITVNVHNYGHPPAKNMSWLPYLMFGTSATQQYYGDAFDNFPTGGVTANANGLYDFTFTVSNLNMTSGTTYRLVVSDTCLRTINCLDYTILPYISATIHYSDLTPPPSGGTPPLPIAGGLRVKKITNFNNDGSITNTKLFSYEPGKLLRYPTYYRHYQQDVTDKLNTAAGTEGTFVYCSPNWADLKEVTSTSQSILGFTQSSPVGYTQVTEQDIDNTGKDKGYTISGFTFVPDSLNGVYTDGAYWSEDGLWMNQMAGVNNFDHKRGLLSSKDIYKRNLNNTYTKVYSLTNAYNFNDYDPVNHYRRVLAARVIRLRFPDFLYGGDSYNCGPYYLGYRLPGTDPFRRDFGYSPYAVITGWVQNTKSTEVQYDQNGLNPATKITNTYYDNRLHMQPTRIVTTKSNNDSIVSLSSYAQDYAAGTPFIDSMVTHNVIATSIENIIYKVDPSLNRTILSGKIMTFKPDGKRLPDKIRIMESATPVALSSFKFSNAASGLLPYNVTVKGAFSPDSRYVDRVTFAGFDGYANTLEQYKVGDAHASYIWDYNKMYPVAEVKNAAQTDIAYTSFESDGTGNWTVPSAIRNSSSAITGSRSYTLNNGSVSKNLLTTGSTYIVSYWSTTGSFSVSGSTGLVTGRTVNINGVNWTNYEHTVTNTSSVTVSGTGSIDELRLYPKTAQMTTYTYTPLIGMTAQCDAGGKIMYYEYDSFNRLKLIRDQDSKIVKQFDYQYRQTP